MRAVQAKLGDRNGNIESLMKPPYVPGYDRAFIESERPDIVIEEMVERGPHAPIYFPMR